MFTKSSNKILAVLMVTVFCFCGVAFGADESKWGKSDFSFTYSSYNANGTIAGRSGYTTSTGTDSTLTKFNLTTDQFYKVMAGVGVLLDKTAMTGSTESTDQYGKLTTMSYTGEGNVVSYKYDDNGMLIGGDMVQEYKQESSLDGKVISVTEGTTSGTCAKEDIFFGEVVFRNTQTDYKSYDYYQWKDENENNLVEDSELTKKDSDDVNSIGYMTTRNVYDRRGGRNITTDTYTYDVNAESQEALNMLKNNFERYTHNEDSSIDLKGDTRWSERTMHQHFEYDDQGHLLAAWGMGGMQGNTGDGSGYFNTWGKDADTWLNGNDDYGAKGVLENLGEVIEKAKNGEDSFADVPSSERNALVTNLEELKTKFQSDNYWAENIQPTCNKSGQENMGNLGQGIFEVYTITSTGQAKLQFTFQNLFSGDLAGDIPNQTDPKVSGTAFSDQEGKWYLRSEDNGIVSLSGDVAKANLKDGESASVNGGWLGYGPQNAMFVVK